MKLDRFDFIFCFVCSCVLSVFVYAGWINVDLQYLGATSGDELPQFKQLNNVLYGYLNFDLEKMFRIEFYNYGYIYYLLNVIVTAPFNLLGWYEWSIFAPRFLNGVFSILNLWMIYKISNLYLKKSLSLFLVVFCLTIPAFWHFGYIFKPDVFQAFFVLWSVYFLCLDRFEYGKNFYLSVLMLGLGVGVAKFQAVMFLPLVCLYGFGLFFKSPSLRSFCSGVKISLACIFSVMLIWIISNPYLLNPTGAKAWLNMFVFNMHSNATNHEAYTYVSFWDKMLMESDLFFSPILLVFAIVGVMIVLWKKREGIWIVVFSSFVISLFYLLVLVNKAWGIYYISTFFLLIVLFVPLLRDRAVFWIPILCVLQIGHLFFSHSFENMSKDKVDLTQFEEKNSEILNLLKPYVSDQKVQIYSNGLSFFPMELGLDYTNIHSNTFLLPHHIDKNKFQEKYPHKSVDKYFIQWDLILLDKQIIQNNQNIALQSQDAKQSLETIQNLDQLNYHKIDESKHYLLYQYQGVK